MPKQRHEIREFTKGIITSVSEGDIPENSATFSQNLDPIAKSGVLKALPKDQILSTSGFEDSLTGTALSVGTDKIALINDTGTYRAITASSVLGTGKISKIDDIFGSSPNIPVDLDTSVISSANQFSMEVNNKEVHIGTGDGNTDTPKWAGIVSNGQFGNTYSGIQLEDAAIESPMSFPAMDDVGTDNDYVYGFSKEYNQLFKFSMDANPALLSTSAVIDCEEIMCMDVFNPAIDGGTPDVTKTKIFLIVKKYDVSETNNDTYRIKEFDYQFNETLSKVFFYAGMTDAGEDIESFNFHLGSNAINFGLTWTNNMVPTKIKCLRKSATTYQIWIVTVGNCTLSYSEPFVVKRLAQGTYLWNTSVSEGFTDGYVYELTCRTPFNFCYQGGLTLPNSGQFGYFVVATDQSSEVPTAINETVLNGRSITIHGLVSIKDVNDGSKIGIIAGFDYGGYGYSIAGTGAGSKICLKVKNAGDKCIRVRLMYIIMTHDFTESTAFEDYPTGGTNRTYIPTPLFNTDTGTTSLDANNCMVYHFGKKPTHADATEIDVSSGGFSWRSTYWSRIIQNIHVNPQADTITDTYGTCSIREWNDSTSDWSGNYYLRKFANPVHTEASIGFDSGVEGFEVVLLDEKDATTIINGHYIPEDNDKLIVLFGRSDTDEAQLGIFENSGGNWYSSGADTNTYTKADGGLLNLTIPNTLLQTSTFINGYRYFYKVSFVYDGYQESPLTPSISYDYAGTTNAESIVVDIGISENVNKRVSHCVLYRADSGGTSLGLKPLGFYRQVAYLPLSHHDFTYSNGVYTYSFVDNGSSGISYEASSGLPEGLLKCTPKYALSTQLNNTHFVARINFPLLGSDLSNYMFKSMPYNFDQFDWTKDLLKLPTTPTALASFNGRIYAFDENNTYRIEPNSLYIEDTFEGSGCFNSDSLVVTEYGMFYCDKNNVYMHNGNRPTPIADTILSPNDDLIYNWHGLGFNVYTPKMAFDSKRKSIVIAVKYKGSIPPLNHSFYWIYNIVRQRWDKVSLDIAANGTPPDALFSSNEGDVIIVYNDYFYRLFSHTSDKRNWSWYSKRLDMRSVTSDKLFTSSVLTGSDDVHSDSLSTSLTIKTSNGTVTPVFRSYNDSGEYRYHTSSNKKGKWLQYQFSNIDGDTEIDSIGTLYKPK